jgi:hypothetical protein
MQHMGLYYTLNDGLLWVAAPARGLEGNPYALAFDGAAAGQLTPARRAQLDVDFFNEFWAKSESGPSSLPSARAARIRAMAAEGFEVAYLADRLYNFERNGIPSFAPDYRAHWRRLKKLAKDGDPSAQCLFSHTAVEYRAFNLEPPTLEDMAVLAPQYRKAAALQGHAYCSWLYIAESGETDETRITQIDMRCAKAGVTVCQQSLASRYRSGRGVEKNSARGFCWLMKARSGNSAPSVENGYRLYLGLLRNELGPERTTKILNVVTAGTDCDQYTIN